MSTHDIATTFEPEVSSVDSWIDGAKPVGLGANASEDDPAFRLLLQQTQHAVQKQVHGVELPKDGPQVFLGRYRVESLAGRGGMGTVLAAEDAWLERKVALKVVNTPGVRQRRRLVREGRALAKLSHPNVVQVHDVELGERGEHAYVAMEYVEGTTLARWQGQERRSTKEILDKYRQAAQGLWAAHQVGIVHRDFKPHNVLVDVTGVVKVVDFGLASASEPDTDDRDDGDDGDVPRAIERAATAPQAVASEVTETSVGLTPGYCPPEQLRGERPTERADQFGFCVALYEALTGVLPFGSTRVAEDYERVVAVGIARRVEAAGIPRRVLRVLARGLAVRPEDRFEDMTPIITALGPRAARWPWVSVGLVPVAAVLTAVLMPAAEVREVEVDPCVFEDDALPLVRVPGGLAPSETAGPQAFVAERAATYRASWKSAREELCRAEQRGEIEGAGHDQAQICLRTAAREFDLVMKLVTAEGSRTEPFAAFGNLYSPERCVIGGGRPIYGAADSELQGELDDVRDLQLEGRNEEALPRARALHERALVQGDVPILAQVSFLEGKLEGLLDDGESAARALEDALRHAERLGDDILAINALAELIDVAANMSQDPTDGTWWLALGEAKLERSGALQSEVAGQYYSAAANLAYRKGDFETALKHGKRAHELLTAALGEGSLAALTARANHAVALVGAGRLPDAIAEHEEILTEQRRIYGEQHPVTLYEELRLAMACMKAKDHEQALEGFTRVEQLAPTTTKEGQRLRALAATRQCEVLANQDLRRRDFSRSRPVCERAYAIRHHLEGNDRRLVQERSILYGKQALVLAWQGHNEQALELLEQERELLLSVSPSDPHGLARNSTNRCGVLAALERPAECGAVLDQNLHWYESSDREDELAKISRAVVPDWSPTKGGLEQ